MQYVDLSSLFFLIANLSCENIPSVPINKIQQGTIDPIKLSVKLCNLFFVGTFAIHQTVINNLQILTDRRNMPDAIENAM